MHSDIMLARQYIMVGRDTRSGMLFMPDITMR
jgi:hypothetical protein